MASLVPNFEYDIFISYRHNDNRSGGSAGLRQAQPDSSGGWVTEFVNALQEELAATIKEPLTIYFDKNPHDGLQQHHEVDDSLKEKLRSLILIPIISQTYCDPKAFAWAHELIPFVQQANADTLGLKTRVGGGNIASRVLPVKIHDIDSGDKQLFEEATGSVMRSIDFIYKESGVNRPLRPADDRTHNQQHTDYRNQVNKVANAIKEIITGLRTQEGRPDEVKPSATTEPSRINYKPSPKFRWKPSIPRVPIFSLSLTTIVLAIGFIGIAFLHLKETEVEIQTIRSVIPPPEGTRYYEFAGNNFELSPDGKLLAYVGTDSAGNYMLWVRPLNSLVGKPLSGTEGAMLPFWSPDSRFIGFFDSQNLKKILASGGPPQIICEATSLGRGGTWNRDGTIVFNRDIGGPLYRVSASGGPPIPVTKLDSTMNHRSHRYPYFLPDGKHFLYMARTAVASIGLNDALYVGSLDTTFVSKLIVPIKSSFAYANGQLVYLQGEMLVAQSFDSHSFLLEGEAKPIAEDVGYVRVSGKASFSVSQSGLLAYQEGYFNDEKRLVLRDRKGNKLTAVDRIEDYLDFRISPDEKKIAIAFGETKGTVGDLDIWLYEMDRSIWTRFTFDAATPQQWPIWSPDGSTLMYSSLSSGVYDLFQRSSDGSSAEKIVYKSGERKIAYDWSPDGRFVIYGVQLHGQSDLWILPMDDKQPGKPYPFLATPFDESAAEFSPDGRWVAYNSNESGRPEVYIRPFPGPGGKRQVSTEGGSAPRWSKDGKEILYISLPDPNIIMAAEIKSTASTLELGTARKLLEFNSVGQGERFDVAQNGDQLMLVESKNEFVLRPVTLVTNWPEELKKK